MTLSTDMQMKILEFKKTIVMHPQYSTAIETMLHGMDATYLRGEPCSTLLIGESGTGKSTACAHMINIVGGKQTIYCDTGCTKQVHAFDCAVPATYSINDLCIEMLKQLGDDPETGKLSTHQNRLFRLLITCETRLIIIDDIHDLLNRGAEKTWKNVCKWIKYIANTTGIPIILSGKSKAESLINQYEELDGRYPYRARLHNIRYDEIFVSILSKLNLEMNRFGEFTTPLHITDSQISGAFYLHTHGNMRELRTILLEIMLAAATRGDHTVIPSDCIYAADKLNKMAPELKYNNPFKLPWSLIKQKIEELENA